ncbi:MAG: TonB-dependent receptor [Rhizomicrobium sp.]
MNVIHRALLCGVSLAALCGSCGAAFAEDPSTVETVIVSGVRSSLRDSIDMKKNSDLVTDNISSKDIGELPDITIAEELNRLPGLNTTLDRGNASQASVRGLGPRLVLGLVNGREVASSEPDQNVRWEIYPSEMVAGATVIKSQSASLLDGGIAATIDIKTLRPLDYEGPALSLRVGPEYNEEANAFPNYTPWGLRGSAAYITHLDDTLAIALAGSFQREQNGYDSFQGWGYNLANSGTAGDVTGDGVPDSTPWGAQSAVTEIQQDRMALSGVVQWRPSSSLEVTVDALYSAYAIHENQFQAWYGDNNNLGDYTYPQNSAWCGGADSWAYDCVGGTTGTPPNLAIQNGVVSGGTLGGSYISVTNVIAKYTERHTLAVGGVNAKWTAGAWQVTADLSHSEAWRNNQWAAIEAEVYPTSSVFNTGAGVVPSWQTYSDNAATVPYNPADVSSQFIQTYRPGQVTGPEHTMDNLSAAQLDVTRAFDGSGLTSFDFGLRYSGRKKSHTDNSWLECGGAGASTTDCSATSGFLLPAADLSNFTVKDYNAPPMLYGNFDQLAAAAFTNFSDGHFTRPAGTDVLGEHWTVNENSFQAYVKAGYGFALGSVPVDGSVGVRVSNVSSTSTGYLTDGTGYTPSTASKNYTDVLPSLNANFHLADDQIVRFGASIAVSRPPLDELRVGNSISTSPPYTGSEGNPLLNPYKADQVDLDYEWYFRPEALFVVAGYFKHLNSFIGYQTHAELINGNTYTIAQPVNGPGGDVAGLEVTLQTPFYFLPGILSDFGIYTNYSYVSSGVHEFAPVANPLEATGLARHTAEMDLWYSRDGLEARLAYKIHSPFTIIAGWNSQTLTRLQWERTLDASLSYQWNESIGFRFQARNLTNGVSRSYWDNNPSELARYDTFGRSYLFDISYRL